MGFALIVETLALWNMTHFNTNMTLHDAAMGRLWQHSAFPFYSCLSRTPRTSGCHHRARVRHPLC